jgi:hypothetical protein
MLLTAGISSSINAQLPANNASSSNNDQSTSKAISPVKSNGVRITSPIDGEQISSNGKTYFNKNGEILSINGFSIYEKNNSSDCKVFVIVNNVKPYQLTNATGKSGSDDYSTWQYNFNSFYTPFKEGSNKITSKLTCQPGNINSFYSVNVTGSTINGTFPSQVATPLMIGNNSSSGVSSTEQTNTTSAPPTSNTTASVGQNITSGTPIVPSTSTPVTTSAAPLQQTNTTSAPPTSNTGSINLNPKSGAIPHVGPSALTPNPAPLKQNDATSSSPNSDTGVTNLSPQSTGTPKIGQPAPTTPSENVGTINLNPQSTGTPTIGQPTPSQQSGLKSLDIDIDSEGSGDNQDIVITVQDSITSDPINGSSINGKINDISFSGKTDSDGEFSEEVPSEVFESSTSVDVALTVNANGYKPNKADTTLRITPEATPDADAEATPDADAEATNSDLSQDNAAIGNQDFGNGGDLASIIMNDVQNELSKQGINIPLPFG